MKAWHWLGLGLLFVVCVGACNSRGNAREKSAAERGRETLLGTPLSSPILSAREFDHLWKQWGLAERPADFNQQLRERYGLHLAPYDNHGRPMGFRDSRSFLGKGLTNDCMLCHASSIAGQSYIGAPNTSLDLEGLYEDLLAATGLPGGVVPTFSNVRGTIEATAAVFYLMQFRDANLNFRPPQKADFCTTTCEDIPAWWLLKKKKTMYHTGNVDTRAVRSMMTFMLSPLYTGEYIKKHEPLFADIKAYLLTLEPPKYPFPIDAGLAAQGEAVFTKTCARCHGTYGPNWTYPNKVVSLDVIGTDPTLATKYDPKALLRYQQSWLAQEKGPDGKLYTHYSDGYQAPPLDGIWATAPYFHNGSAPTVYHVLNSKARPKIFTRSYHTDKEDLDPVKLGWKITVSTRGRTPDCPPVSAARFMTPISRVGPTPATPSATN
jgi:hypothetical protein